MPIACRNLFLENRKSVFKNRKKKILIQGRPIGYAQLVVEHAHGPERRVGAPRGRHHGDRGRVGALERLVEVEVDVRHCVRPPSSSPPDARTVVVTST